MQTCKHETQETRTLTMSDGRTCLVKQCQMCGKNVVGVKKNTYFYPPFDEELRKAWDTAEQAERTNHYQKIEQDRNDRTSEWWQRYQAHLSSPKWRDLRRMVLARAGHICEGCGYNPASQVHHLTYKHMGDELLFELVAVCDDCHGRIHPHMLEDISYADR